MISRFQPTAHQGGSISLQVVGQSRRTVTRGQGVADVRLASADCVASLLTQLRRPVRIGGIKANGQVTDRYRAGDRDWLVVFKA